MIAKKKKRKICYISRSCFKPRVTSSYVLRLGLRLFQQTAIQQDKRVIPNSNGNLRHR